MALPRRAPLGIVVDEDRLALKTGLAAELRHQAVAIEYKTVRVVDRGQFQQGRKDVREIDQIGVRPAPQRGTAPRDERHVGAAQQRQAFAAPHGHPAVLVDETRIGAVVGGEEG